MAQRPANRPSQRKQVRKTTRPSPHRGASGGGGNVLAFLIGAILLAGLAYLYIRKAHPTPAANAPVEHTATPAKHTPAPTPKPPAAAPSDTPPFSASEDVFESAAHLYRAQCVQCHGSPAREAHDSGQGATQYFAHGADPTRVAHPGTTFKAIQTGVPMTAMPAYRTKLTDRQIWQLALLLQASTAELPDPVAKILNGR